jgi:acyl-CoA synthetase (NDP forming)
MIITFLNVTLLGKAMKQLDQQTALNLLSKYKIPVCRSQMLTTESIKTVKSDYPVVLKTAAPEVVHKSDIGAVIAGIQNHAELLQAAHKISINVKSKYPAAKDIFLIQEQIKGRELIIGMKRDSQFGPVIMFGLGGIFVEVFKDVSFRIAPVTKEDAASMVSEIKGNKILAGARGEKPANIDAIIDIILKVSKLCTENDNLAELDLNPVMVNEKEAKAVDVRIMGDYN